MCLLQAHYHHPLDWSMADPDNKTDYNQVCDLDKHICSSSTCKWFYLDTRHLKWQMYLGPMSHAMHKKKGMDMIGSKYCIHNSMLQDTPRYNIYRFLHLWVQLKYFYSATQLVAGVFFCEALLRYWGITLHYIVLQSLFYDSSAVTIKCNTTPEVSEQSTF